MLAVALALASINASQRHDVTVSIDFGNPSGFTNIEIDGFSGEKEQSIIFDLLREALEENASSYLPDGYILNI